MPVSCCTSPATWTSPQLKLSNPYKARVQIKPIRASTVPGKGRTSLEEMPPELFIEDLIDDYELLPESLEPLDEYKIFGSPKSINRMQSESAVTTGTARRKPRRARHASMPVFHLFPANSASHTPPNPPKKRRQISWTGGSLRNILKGQYDVRTRSRTLSDREREGLRQLGQEMQWYGTNIGFSMPPLRKGVSSAGS